LKNILATFTVGLLSVASLGWCQSPPPVPAKPPLNSQINLQVLAETLRTAATFHDLVKNLNVEKNLNPDGGPAPSADPLKRTAAIVGAGAGAGAAIGELRGGQKAVLIGILAGAVGGLVVDQVMRHNGAKPEPQAAFGQLDRAQQP
jgi:hypothetical protein